MCCGILFHNKIRKKQNVTNNDENLKKTLKTNISSPQKRASAMSISTEQLVVNINKKTVMFSNLRVLKTTKYLSRTTDLNQKNTVYEKKVICHHDRDIEQRKVK